MPKQPANQNKQWSNQDLSKLQKLADQNTPTRLIAWHLKRTANSIRSKAQAEDMSLKPVNQSPYNRKKT